MQLSSWLQEFRQSVNQRRKSRRRQFNVSAETLESKTLLTVTGVLIGTELDLFIDGSDSVTVRANSAGRVEVLGNGVVLGSVPSIAANTLTGLLVQGSDTDNVIDVSALTTAQFSALGGITLSGGNGTDRITGSDGFAESILGGDGNDIIVGGDGNDSINGGNGNDSITAGLGGDVVLGGDGNDTVDAGAGNDSINAGDGNDRVTAGDGDDTVDASHGADSIAGGNGNDSMVGGFGIDTVNGEAGNDTIYGGADNDSLLGGDGNDQITGNAGNDTINGEAGDDNLDGSDGNDLIDAGAGNDTANGSAGNDTIGGSSGDDLLYGGAGNDNVDGGAGNDTLNGHAGDDTLSGGSGNDSVRGGTGNDLLLGGPPGLRISDAFVAEGNTGTTLLTFTITLSSPIASSVTVDVSTVNGSAVSGTDFTALTNFPVTFAPNTTTRTVTVTVLTDAVQEADENLYLTLTNALGADVDDGVAEGIILNDDAAPIVTRTLYAFDGGVGQQLASINTTTAVSQNIGSPGFTVQGMASSPTGTLYGIDVSSIYTLDTQTGAATRLFGLGAASIGEGDIAYEASTGLIYGIDFTNSNFVVIDLVAQTATVRAQLNVNGVAGGRGLDWDGLVFRGSTLYGYMGPRDGTTGLANHLFTVDTQTGAVTDVGLLSTTVGFAGDIAYDAARDVFYLMSRASSTLFEVNPTTAVATPIGNTGLGDVFALDYVVTGSTTPPIVVVPPPVVPGATTGADTLFGEDGNDTIIGSRGDDIADGGNGNDRIDGGDGNDIIDGRSGQDSLNGNAGDDTINGQAGNDTLAGGGDNDTYIWDGTNAGADVLAETPGQQSLVINGTAAADTFAVGASSGKLQVTRGTASITANSTISRVTINAAAGNDTITVGNVSTVPPTVLTINGDAGDDFINATNSSLGTVRFTANGGDGVDALRGGPSAETLNGGAGNDFVLGNGGNDSMTGGDGIDTLDGSDGNDSISGDAGDDSIKGGAGNDIIAGGADNDFADGQDGNDSVTGGEGADTVVGSAGNDTVRGENGDDTVLGGAGNDVLDGGVGNDELRGHTGDDQIKGGHGNDRIYGDQGVDTIDGGDGNDFIDSSFGADTVPGGSGGIIAGGDGDDTIQGGIDDDTILAGDGNDLVSAGAGQDVLFGQDGNDTLSGNGGTDLFNAGQGTNTLDAASPERDNRQLTISTAVLQALSVLAGL